MSLKENPNMKFILISYNPPPPCSYEFRLKIRNSNPLKERLSKNNLHKVVTNSLDEQFSYGSEEDYHMEVTFDMKAEHVHRTKKKMLLWI